MILNSCIMLGSKYMCNTFAKVKIQIGLRTKVLNGSLMINNLTEVGYITFYK